MVSDTNKICPLKTAVATASSSHAEAKTNILFDETPIESPPALANRTIMSDL